MPPKKRVRIALPHEASMPVRIVTHGPSDPVELVTTKPSDPIRIVTEGASDPVRGSFAPPAYPPILTSAEVGNVGATIVTLLFDEPVTLTSGAWKDGWAVEVNGGWYGITGGVQMNPQLVHLILTLPVVYGDVVNVWYNKATGHIVDVDDGLQLNDIVSFATTNNVPFTPLGVAGLICWHDFSVLANLFVDAAKTIPVVNNGDLIGAVVDRSTNGKDATTAIVANKPLYKINIQNGLSMALGQDASDTLTTAAITHGIGTGDFYVACVMKMGASITAYSGISGEFNYYPSFYSKGAAHLAIWWYASELAFLFSTLQINTPYLVEFWRLSGNIYAALNAVQDPTVCVALSGFENFPNGAMAILNSTTVGGEGLRGYLGEFAFYKGFPSSSIAALRAYWNLKWVLYP